MELKIFTIFLVLILNSAQFILTREISSVTVSNESAPQNEKSDSEKTLTIHKDSIPAESSSSYEQDDEDENEGEDDDDEDDSDGPPDHTIPYSEHEEPKEIATKPKYTAPGAWAKPPPEKDIQLEFVPTKLYAQVRGTHTVKHVPREGAIESAETNEERKNAPRLKEVVNNRKVNTVYTEEGYEDSAYDHAGHIRDADFHEGFARKLENELDTAPDDDENVRKPAAKKYPLKKHQYVELLDDYRDDIDRSDTQPSEIKKEYETADVKRIKNNLKEPIFNPKKIVKEGIFRLEKDLKEEYKQAAKASEINATSKPPEDETEVYEKTTILPQYQVEEKEESTYLPKNYETDTIVVDVNGFTTLSTNSPEHITLTNAYVNLNNVPLSNVTNQRVTKDFGVESFATSTFQPSSTLTLGFPSVEIPVTESAGDEFWKFFIERQRQRGTSQLTALESEPLTIRSATDTSTPIALTLVNGHGPYLWVTESVEPGFTPTPLQDLIVQPADVSIKSDRRMEDLSIHQLQDDAPLSNLETFLDSVSSNENHSSWDHNPFLGPKVREIETVSGKKIPHYNVIIRGNGNNHLANKKRKNKKHESEKKKVGRMTHGKSTRNNFLQNVQPGDNANMLERLTVLQPPILAASREITYFNYLRDPHADILGQSRVKVESETPKEIGYEHTAINRVKINGNRLQSQVTKKSAFPATSLQPPPPSSKSEYASFAVRNRRNDFVLPEPARIPIFHPQRTVWIHGFRRKRSVDLNEEIAESDKNNQKIFGARIKKKVKHLLNESPRITEGVINKEIDKRFKSNNTNHNTSDEPKENNENTTGVEVDEPDFDFSDELENTEEKAHVQNVTDKKMEVDRLKYPFYENRDSRSTALKYVLNPRQIPHKTLGGMEFYNSRNIQCDDVEPDLTGVTPKEEEPSHNRSLNENAPRLQGLGNKLDCYKAKYFDKNPLDNPLFMEKSVGQPTPPSELNPKYFASKIVEMSIPKEENINQKLSKRPEVSVINKRESPPRNMHAMSINYGLGPKSRDSNHFRANHTSRYVPRGKSRKRKSKAATDNPTAESISPYQKLVYEDVMGTIQNLETFEKNKIINPFHFRPEPGQFHPNLPINNHHNIPGIKHILPSMRDKGTGVPLIDITERPLAPKYANIDGLFPPRGHLQILPVRNKNILYTTRPDYNHEESPWQHLRLFKRNVGNTEILQENILKPRIEVLRNDPETLTTPIYRRIKRPLISVSNLLIANHTTPKIGRIVYPNDNKSKHTPSADKTRNYGKFTNDVSSVSTVDIRRMEPRYAVPRRRNVTHYLSTSTNRPSTIGPLIGRVPPTATSFSDSTLVAVVVKPDANFTIPQESRRTKMIKEIQDQDLETSIPTQDFRRDHSGPLPGSEIDHIAQKNIQRYDNLGMHPENVINKKLNKSDVDNQQSIHSRLHEYSKLPKFEEVETSSKDLKTNPKLESNKTEIDVLTDRSDKEEDSEENSEESSSEDNSFRRSDNEDDKSEEDDSSEKDESEPFTRFTSRPDSPPENYYDERYADLGPRINKPAFYHPQFDTPEYEKSHFEKSDDHSEEDPDHSAESSEHYVFPWERDNQNDDEEDAEESEHSFFTYEFPWERREREERERRLKERPFSRLHRDYYYADEDDEEEAATSHGHKSYIYHPQKSRYYKNNAKSNVFDNAATGTEPRPQKKFSSKIRSNFRTPDFPDQVVKSTENEEQKLIIANDTMLSLEKLFNITPLRRVAIPNATTIPKDKERVLKTKITTLNTTSPEAVSTSNPTSRKTLARSRRINEAVTQKSETTTIVPRFKRRRSRNYASTTSKPEIASTVKSTRSSVNRRRKEISADLPTTTSVPSRQNLQKRHRRPMNNTQNSMKSKHTFNDEITKVSSYNSEDPNTPPSTSKTIHQRSRISKKTITKTYYPNDEDDDDVSTNENHQTPKAYFNTSRKKQNSSRSDKPIISKQSESVSIITKETPDHVYRTEEIDKDGVKGKFITIIANNKTMTPSVHVDELSRKGTDVSEMDRDMDTFGKFDTVISDSEDTDNFPGAGMNLNRKHRAVHLSEHNTKHSYDSVSWVSENYT